MPSNVRLSGAQTSARTESDVRINRSNPSQIIGASNDNGGSLQAQFSSTDGGGSWSQSALPAVAGQFRQSDPAVDWTSDGTAWALTIVIKPGPVFSVNSFTSPDGQNWTFDAKISGAQTGTDKPNLWVDHGAFSAHRDNIYALWWDTGTGDTFVARRLGPAGAWQAPVQVSGAETTGGSDGGDIKTNAFGDVFAFWPSTTEKTLNVAKSTDGGQTFGAAVQVANTSASFLIGFPAQDIRSVAGGTITGALLYISGGAYRTATEDFVYAIWMDLAGGAGCNSDANEPHSNVASACKVRIWFSRSADGGGTWDAPKKINDQASLNDQFFPRLAVDDATGQLMVVYYDTVGDAGRVITNVWMQTSADNGTTWSDAQQVTTSPTDETTAGANQNQYGDYIGLTGFNGNFFACWTDRRSGTREEIWGARLRPPSCSLIIDKSTFGQDEVEVGLPGTSSFTPAYWVAVDGFTKSQLGLNNPGDLNAPPVLPTLTATVDSALNPALNGGQVAAINNMLSVDVLAPPVVPIDPTLTQDPQRFLYPFTISFNGDGGFTALPPEKFAYVTLSASITAGGATRTASAVIELTTGEDPYFQNVDLTDPNQPFWLSFDLRFFKVTTGNSRFGANPLNAADAPGFIANVITNLNTPGTDLQGDTFEGLFQDEETSALEFLQDGLTFNFALARVRMIANGAVMIPNVRVFFRLFQAQSTVSDFNENTTYRFGANNVPAGHKIPRMGVQNDQSGNPEYVTIPCFASPRINLTAPANMDGQQDPPNVQNISITTPGVELDSYFGCWIDINQSDQFLPLTPPAGNFDGAWTAEFNNHQLKTLNEVITRAPHQCMIAEIRFDDTPIPPGATSATSDKLAQRNIAWLHGPNPGVDASRRVPHTFEVRPTGPLTEMPDELMIMWGSTPLGSTASVYMPAVSATEIVTLANLAYGNHQLSVLDPHTIECPVGGVTFIPIPRGTSRNAGLMTIDLHPSIRREQVFNIAVRQITEGATLTAQQKKLAMTPGAAQVPWFTWRRLLGAFQFTISVSTKEHLLAYEERLLSWLRWIAQSIPIESRWYPIFQRYLDQVGGRVKGFGGDPNDISPSPDGQGRASSPFCRRLKLLFALLLALFLIVIPFAAAAYTAPLIAVGLVILLAVAGFWYRRCKPSLCDLLCALILGISGAYLILGVLILLGFKSSGLLLLLALLGVLNAFFLIIAWLRGCCGKCKDQKK
jgi:sucrose-6-phosphate hydrolase SacC (GH32 family)